MANASRRVLVIGGDAAGMSAASQARRLAGDEVELVVVERGRFTSYSACGIPYWVAGDVGTAEELIARSPEEHRRRGLDVRIGVEAVGVDLDRREAEVRDAATGAVSQLGFDELVLGTGAVPVRPDIPGIDARGVYGVQTLTDGQALLDALAADQPRRAVVVGAGYIGLEMAEAMVRRGLEVTVVDRGAEPMSTLDPAMGRLVREAMERLGIRVAGEQAVLAIETDAGGRAVGVRTAEGSYAADVVVLGIGVRPATELAEAAGLPLGASGGLRVDDRQRVIDGVWSAGDCVESWDRVSASWVHVPLGTHANKQGRVLGTNLGGGRARFPGIVRTAVSKICSLEVARTGLREVDARRAGLDHVAVTVESTTRAGYFPGTRPLTVRMLAEREGGRLLGAQIVGREGSAKRIDVCALALWNAMTVDELAMTDLSYAPPFAPVWDPVLIAARKAADAR